MKKTLTVELPDIEPRETVNELILRLVSKKPMTAWQISKIMEQKSHSNLRGQISNLVRTGLLECVRCPHCDIGRMYKVK